MFLAVAGYRTARGGSPPVTVIESLAHTICLDSATLTQFDHFRRKRNLSRYDRAGAVSDQEADEMVALARRLRQEVEDWIRKRSPELLQPS